MKYLGQFTISKEEIRKDIPELQKLLVKPKEINVVTVYQDGNDIKLKVEDLETVLRDAFTSENDKLEDWFKKYWNINILVTLRKWKSLSRYYFDKYRRVIFGRRDLIRNELILRIVEYNFSRDVDQEEFKGFINGLYSSYKTWEMGHLSRWAFTCDFDSLPRLLGNDKLAWEIEEIVFKYEYDKKGKPIMKSWRARPLTHVRKRRHEFTKNFYLTRVIK